MNQDRIDRNKSRQDIVWMDRAIALYDSSDKYLDSCSLKYPTDSCLLPFNLEIDGEPDCGYDE